MCSGVKMVHLLKRNFTTPFTVPHRWYESLWERNTGSHPEALWSPSLTQSSSYRTHSSSSPMVTWWDSSAHSDLGLYWPRRVNWSVLLSHSISRCSSNAPTLLSTILSMPMIKAFQRCWSPAKVVSSDCSCHCATFDAVENKLFFYSEQLIVFQARSMKY